MGVEWNDEARVSCGDGMWKADSRWRVVLFMERRG